MHEYCYVHHVPGRLRVKNTRFRDSGAFIADLEACFENRDGIYSISSNPLLGSVLFRYDPALIDHDSILDQLGECGFLEKGEILGLDETMRRNVSSFCDQLGRMLLTNLMGSGLRGANLAFLAAIL